MKILVVSQYFYPENFRINDLVDGLVERGYNVTVLTGQPNYPEGRFPDGYGWFGSRRETIRAVEVIRVPLVARGSSRAFRLVLNYLSFALFASLATFFRVPGRFDAIFVFAPSPVTVGIPAYFARRRFGAPILFWVLDLWPESLAATGAIQSPVVLRLVGHFVRWVYQQCNYVLVQSKGFFGNVAELGVPVERIRYFPNWIESEYLSMDSYRDEAETQSDRLDFRIVFAGNIGAAQDFPTILDAAEIVTSKMPNVRWVIAGDGRLAAWVHSEVERRGLGRQFEFLGQLPPARMPAIFATADALLVALRADPVFSLTIPGKTQSYLAAGKPVLAMLDGEGAKMLSESGGGLACGAGDAKALAALVFKLSAMSAEQRQAMGLSGQTYALREFGRDLLFERLEGWFAEAIEENKRKG